MAEKVGFIGLGIMGKPMAKNLIEAGYELVLYNRTLEKAEELAEDGAEVAANPKEVAENSGIIVTMLPDSPDVRNVVAGEDGVLEEIKEGALVVDMSTISPVVTEELAAKVKERGASMLDAPVSGGDVGAIEGTLSIMVGGSEEDFERARPLFEVMGGHREPRRAHGSRPGNQGGQPGRGGAHHRGCQRGAGSGFQRRGRPRKNPRRPLGWPRRQQGHGGQEGEISLPQVRSRFPVGAAPQGPRYSARGGQGVRRGAARNGDRGSDAPDDEEEGLGRRGPLRALEGHRGSLAARDRVIQ